jgi:hypothetical protein
MLENLLYVLFFLLGGLIFWALILMTGSRIELDPFLRDSTDPPPAVTILGPAEPRLYDWAEDPSL